MKNLRLFDIHGPLPSQAGAVMSQARKDKGIRKAELNTDDVVLEALRASCEYVCANRDEFTSDAVWYDVAYLLDMTPANTQRITRVLPGQMRQLARRGLAVDTGRSRMTDRASGNRRKLTVWKSTKGCK